MKLSNHIILILLFSHFWGLTNAQIIPNERIVDWSKAGLTDTKPTFKQNIYLSDYGVDTTGFFACDQALSSAIQSANGESARILMGSGTFLFKKPINLVDSILIQGEGYLNTKMIFDLNQNIEQDAFQIYGEWTNESYPVIQDINLHDSVLVAGGNFIPNDLLYIQFEDSSLVNDYWARGHVSQLCTVKSITNDTLEIDEKFRRAFLVSNQTKARIIKPIEWCGISCLSIERRDTAIGISSNIGFKYARNCFVESVYSQYCNFGHVRTDVSSHIEVSDSYFQEANDYGGGGKGYGVVFMTGSGSCKAENNIFRKLRHAMLLQSGANGNVYAYNCSIDPFWTGTNLPSNSAGDLVCHGNYPFANLFEGNVAQNLVIDDSHKDNGPYNTFFRNRLETYGIFMNNNPASNSQNFIGNEVTTTIPFVGYLLNGINHFTYGNNVKGTCTPTATQDLSIQSLYLKSIPSFFNSTVLPIIGYPLDIMAQKIPAQERYLNGQLIAGCGISTKSTELISKHKNFMVYPNPTQGLFVVISEENPNDFSLEIISISGNSLKQFKRKNSESMDISDLKPGVYILKITNLESGRSQNQLVVKSI